MIKLWMLIRALDLLKNVSNVQFGFFLERDNIMYQMTQTLRATGIVTTAMRYALWEKANLQSFCGFMSDDGYLLIVKSSFLTQDVLDATMSTIIQYPANYSKDQLCTQQKTAEKE